MRRRDFVTLLGGASVGPVLARAQGGRMLRVGVLTGLSAGDPLGEGEIAAFQEGLKEVGWSPGRNIQIEYRWPGTDFDRIAAVTGEW